MAVIYKARGMVTDFLEPSSVKPMDSGKHLSPHSHLNHSRPALFFILPFKISFTYISEYLLLQL
jgi:hypothetical protein